MDEDLNTAEPTSKRRRFPSSLGNPTVGPSPKSPQEQFVDEAIAEAVEAGLSPDVLIDGNPRPDY